MTTYFYLNIVTGAVDYIHCPIEEIQTVYTNLYGYNFPIEEFELLKITEEDLPFKIGLWNTND